MHEDLKFLMRSWIHLLFIETWPAVSANQLHILPSIIVKWNAEKMLMFFPLRLILYDKMLAICNLTSSISSFTKSLVSFLNIILMARQYFVEELVGLCQSIAVFLLACFVSNLKGTSKMENKNESSFSIFWRLLTVFQNFF